MCGAQTLQPLVAEFDRLRKGECFLRRFKSALVFGTGEILISSSSSGFGLNEACASSPCLASISRKAALRAGLKAMTRVTACQA